MIGIIGGLVAGYVYTTFLEWMVHNVLFHRVGPIIWGGRFFGGVFNFHFVEHHQDTHRHQGVDPVFASGQMGWNANGREAVGLAGGWLLHLPLLFVWPSFFVALTLMALAYHYCHRRAHTDIEWGKKYLPWHYEHHFGPEVHANFCVTSCWFDILMGTRRRYPALVGQSETVTGARPAPSLG